MSLLDDVSIVVTPNGYKAGELYAVVPKPTEGAEMLSQPVDLTTDFVANGGGVIVDADTFTTSGGSVDGIANKAANFNLIEGQFYKLVITGTTTSSGFTVGNYSYGNEYGTGFGTHYFVASGTQATRLWIRQQTAGTTNITSFTIKEYTSADMDVTRETAATRVDENGLVNYAEVIGGEEIEDGNFPLPNTEWTLDSEWNISSNKANYDNTGTGSIVQNITFDSSKEYKIKFSISGFTTSHRFDIYTGVSYIKTSTTDSETSYTIYFQGDGGTYIRFRGLSTESFSLSNVSVKEVTRDNVPRIDYTGGGCPHILAEPQRTNLLTYSEDFSQSYWTKQSNITPTYNTTETLSPDGTYNATKLVGNGTDGIYKASISITGVAARSVYLKSVTGTVNVILKDPNLTVTSPTLDVTTEWQRFELTADNGSGGQGIWVDDIPASGIYIWGAQVEESYPTSYIPTSGSTVTRNQDIFTRDGIGSLINDSEGTLYFEGSALENGGGIHRIISLSDGSYDNLIYIRIDSTASRFRGFSRGSSGSYTIITVNSIPQTDNNKIALVWDATNFRIWINGSERATATINNLPVGMNTLNLADPTSSGNFFGKVKQLQVYKTALTDAQLTSLTS